MDEQRQKAYLNLLREMVLHSSSEREVEDFLNAHSDLIDSGLVQTLDALIAMHSAQGNHTWANLLRELATQLNLRINTALESNLEAYRDCIFKFLNTMRLSEGDPKVMYPLLEANLDKLDKGLIGILQILVRENSYKLAPEDDRSIAGTIHDFAQIMEKFPLGNRANNMEISLACCKLATEAFSRQSHPQEWGTVQNTWGTAYLDRIEGDRAENIEQAIRCYNTGLQVCTRQNFPRQWAMIQANLGGAYVERIKGDCADNIERAIQSYQLALQFFDKQNHPDFWGTLQNNLGGVYISRIRGTIATNIETAIACFDAALSVCNRVANPQGLARAQQNLGIAYMNRIWGEYSLNVEQAIYYCEMALEIFNSVAFPRQWADIQSNLGKAYDQRIYGERAENLETAIAYIQAGLSVHTREALPLQWASDNFNLAGVYSDRIKGDREENLDLAITSYQLALSVYTRSAFPERWATTQRDLGVTYFQRQRGDRHQNIEKAVACYQEALSILTREAFPQKWATLQFNLGAAYSNRENGDREENKKATFAAYQAALQIFTRNDFPRGWADIQHNLAFEYSQRITGNKNENMELARRYCDAALEVYSREAFPENWARLQLILANSYRKLGQADKAIAYFRSALEIYTPTSYPSHCFACGYGLGETALVAGAWAEAIEGYGIAIEGVETSRFWVSTDDRRQEIVQDAINVYQNIVQVCVNQRQFDKAIEYVERSRSRRLADLMVSNDLFHGSEIPPEVREYLQQYESLQRQIDTKRADNNSNSKRELMYATSTNRSRAAVAAYNETLQSLEAEKQQLWVKIRRLDPVLAGQIQVSAPNYSAIQKLIDYRTTAILSFYTNLTDTYVFVVRQNKISCHTCVGQGWETLQEEIWTQWFTSYFNSVASKTKELRLHWQGEWKKQFSSFLPKLAQLLRLDDLIAEHLTGIEELIVVPHLYLHLIPFAALPIAEGDCLGDKFLIRYAPSCQVLEFCQKRPPVVKQATPLQYGIVENSMEDLPFTNFECDRIANLYQIPDTLRLKGRSQATVSNYRKLAKQVQALHSSHHAGTRIDNPLESKLDLADGQITLGELMTPGWRLPNLSDVFLSCCETGFGVSSMTDDILTIASGFLCAGARSVVNTLWAVDDLATALFSIFYYQYRQKGSCRPTALQRAQEELRTLSGRTLATVYQPQIAQQLDREFKQLDQARKAAKAKRDAAEKGTTAYQKWDEEYKRLYLAAERSHKNRVNAKNTIHALISEAYPFSHPYYWAAFTCLGLR